jgi:sugar lactone lactonase YvrE
MTNGHICGNTLAMKRFTRSTVVRPLGFLLLAMSMLAVSVLGPGAYGSRVASAISRPGDTTGFVLPFGGTLRFEHLAPTEVIDLSQRNEPIGRARADEIAAAMGFSASDVMTNEQYIKFVTGRGVGGDKSLAILLGQSVGLFINNNGMPLYSTVDGEIQASVLSSFGLMVDPAGMLQSLANESSPSKQVNVDLAPGGYMGDWCRDNGCSSTIRGLYESAYTEEVFLGYLSQEASMPAQLVTNDKNGVTTQIGMSMIPSIWLVNFILLYALNPNYAALMPANWAGIPSQVSAAIWANGGQVPYADFASMLPTYEELLSVITDIPNQPGATAVDSDGNVYVADTGNNLIGKVAPDGTFSVVAGGGATSPLSATVATDALLNAPRGVAVDSAGNVYIADSGNNLVEKVAPDGTFSVVAGGGATSPLSATVATDALLNAPRGVAVDSAGNVYIADSGNNLVEKVAPDGTFSVVAGGGATSPLESGLATQMQLSNPGGVAVDASGNLYIADTGNGLIEEVDAVTGNLYVLAGGGTMTPQESQAATTWEDHFGLGLSIQLNAPEGIAVDSSGIVYIAATGDNVVARLISGIFSVVAGGGTNAPGVRGPGTSAALNGPQGVAVGSSGVVYIANTGSNVLQELGGSITEPKPVAPAFTG